MSWHYSRALVEAYSLENPSDGRASALLSGSHTARLFLPSDRMTDFSRLSRFGMTSAPLTDALGMDVLMWFLVGSRAKTYPLQEKAKALTENAVGFGAKWHESFAKHDPDTSSWRTRQHLLLGGLDEFSETWPKWGSMRNGECWERQTLERHTSASGYGSSHTGEAWPTPRSCTAMAATITPESAWNETRFPNLETVVGRRMWATPTAMAYLASDTKKRKHWPTPDATDRGASKNFIGKRPSGHKEQLTLQTAVGGRLNPTWVEWLMGWPLGWTDLKPLEMVKSHSAPPKHSESLARD